MLLIVNPGNRAPDSVFTAVANKFRDWPNLLSIVFIAYLLGNIPRAFVVGPTDGCCNKLVRIARLKLLRLRYKSYWKQRVRRARGFPYPEVLRVSLRDLRDNDSTVKHINWFPPTTSSAVVAFDYWKLVLCMDQPSAFAFTQVLEARVRFFVGMIWAATGGVVFSLAGLICWLITSRTFDWISLIILLFSLGILGVFGGTLRFVRAEEAVQVLLAYVAHLDAGKHRARIPASIRKAGRSPA